MYEREIKYNRKDRDYLGFLNGKLACTGDTYQDVETKLNNIVFALLNAQSIGVATKVETSATQG